MLKTNFMLIGSVGLIMLLIAAVLLQWAEQLSGSTRYLLTIPPLGVAAYVYVINLLKENQGVELSAVAMLGDSVVATMVAAGIFLLFAAIMIAIVIGMSRLSL